MQWCEARYVSDEPTWEGNGTCTCKRRMTTGCSGSAAPVRVRFVGPSSLTDLQLSLHVVNHLFAWPDATSLDLSVEARRDMIEEARTKPQLLQQVWDTGETSLSNTMEISVGFTRQETSSCGWDEICFCGNGGTLQCILDTWDGTSTLDLPALRRLQASAKGHDDMVGICWNGMVLWHTMASSFFTSPTSFLFWNLNNLNWIFHVCYPMVYHGLSHFLTCWSNFYTCSRIFSAHGPPGICQATTETTTRTTGMLTSSTVPISKRTKVGQQWSYHVTDI